MARKKRFAEGPAIKDVVHVVYLIEAGFWLYWHDRPKSPKFLRNMAVATLAVGCRYGRVKLALETGEHHGDRS